MRESGEMYLETILTLGKDGNNVRSVDIAESLGYSKASVSCAMSKLRADGYIVMDASRAIRLTEKGRAVADKIYERHRVIAKMLTDLGVDEETAVADACRIEHVISDESFSIIKRHFAQMSE